MYEKRSVFCTAGADLDERKEEEKGMLTENCVLTIDIEDTFLEMPQFPEGFTDQFMNGSYFDGINMHDENANCSAAYSTDPEDVNNEYDSFYFYISMGD